jgi:hypothetical protein
MQAKYGAYKKAPALSAGAQDRLLLTQSVLCVRIDQIAILVFIRPQHRLFLAIAELRDIVRYHALEL